MRNYKLTVTVGIPAYNEEANIKRLLLSLLAQKQRNFKFQEIIVVSDGSTDKTVKEAKSVIDQRIIVIERKNREGQTARQNEIFNRTNPDIVILLDADILITKNDFITSLVHAFQTKKNVGIVAANVLPLPAKNLIGKILEWHANWKVALYGRINNADNIYLCYGAARGFSKHVYKSLRWPQISSEDGYSYLTVKQMGMDFVSCVDAVTYFQPPLTLMDHLKQSVRFLNHNKVLSPYFTKKELKKAYSIPKKLFLKAALKGFIKDPIKSFAYLAIHSYCKALAITSGSNSNFHLWEISTSTKTLNTSVKSLN